jgi:hypothetical protein
LGRAKRLSRKRSSTKRPPSLPGLFLDENSNGAYLAGQLQGLGLTVTRFREVRYLFRSPDQQTSVLDPEIFEFIAPRGLLYVSKDQGVKKRGTIRVAVKRHRVGAIIYLSGELRREELAEAFRKGLRKLERFVRSHRAPFVALLGKNGEVQDLEL